MRAIKFVLGRVKFFLVYFAVLSILLWRYQLGLVWLWVGMIEGLLVLGIDHLAYIFANPNEEVSVKVVELAKSRRLTDALGMLVATSGERKRLFFRQTLGQLILLGLGFYLVTSNAGLVGRGLILAANFGILVAEWEGVLGDTGRLKEWLFWNFKGEVTENTVKGYVFGVTIVFLFLTLLSLG